MIAYFFFAFLSKYTDFECWKVGDSGVNCAYQISQSLNRINCYILEAFAQDFGIEIGINYTFMFCACPDLLCICSYQPFYVIATIFKPIGESKGYFLYADLICFCLQSLSWNSPISGSSDSSVPFGTIFWHFIVFWSIFHNHFDFGSSLLGLLSQWTFLLCHRSLGKGWYTCFLCFPDCSLSFDSTKELVKYIRFCKRAI